MDLLKSAVSLLDSRSITIWSNMLDENCRKLLALNGFIESKSTSSAAEHTPTVLVTVTRGPAKVIEYRGTDLLDINNWDLKMLYSDALWCPRYPHPLMLHWLYPRISVLFPLIQSQKSMFPVSSETLIRLIIRGISIKADFYKRSSKCKNMYLW